MRTVLTLAIVISGMLIHAQDSIKIVLSDGIIFETADTRELYENIFKGDTVILIEKGLPRSKVSYSGGKIGWVGNSKIETPVKLDRSLWPGKLVSSYQSQGYRKTVYKKGSTYYTYINGELESTYSTYSY